MTSYSDPQKATPPPRPVLCSECGYTFPLGTIRLPDGQILDPVVESGGPDEHPCVRNADRSSIGMWQQLPGAFQQRSAKRKHKPRKNQ